MDLCDLDLLLSSFHAIMPLLEFAHKFCKVHTKLGFNIFICDFVDAVQLCHDEFYQLYCDPYNRSNGLVFKGFNVLEDHFNDVYK